MSNEFTPSLPRATSFSKVLAAFGAAALLSGAAVAQNHTAEAAPQLNTKPQIAAEAKKSAKPTGVTPIKDGSTAEGEGAGIKQTTKPEAAAQRKAAAREGRPHRDPTQGGTPK